MNAHTKMEQANAEQTLYGLTKDNKFFGKEVDGNTLFFLSIIFAKNAAVAQAIKGGAWQPLPNYPLPNQKHIDEAKLKINNTQLAPNIKSYLEELADKISSDMIDKIISKIENNQDTKAIMKKADIANKIGMPESMIELIEIEKFPIEAWPMIAKYNLLPYCFNEYNRLKIALIAVYRLCDAKFFEILLIVLDNNKNNTTNNQIDKQTVIAGSIISDKFYTDVFQREYDLALKAKDKIANYRVTFKSYRFAYVSYEYLIQTQPQDEQAIKEKYIEYQNATAALEYATKKLIESLQKAAKTT
jgi:hypothetical protein